MCKNMYFKRINYTLYLYILKVRPAEALNMASGVVFSAQFPYKSCYYDAVCLKVWP